MVYGINLILLGPPGSGKGTQASILAKEKKLIHISTGDIFREILKKDKNMAKKIKKYVSTGKLVPDEIVYEVITNKLERKRNSGIVFDGFPRNLNQAKMLDDYLKAKNQKIDSVLYLHLTKKQIIERLKARLICPKCKKNYNLITLPPKQKNICDVCKMPLVKRVDDTLKTLDRRFKIYREETLPLLKYYKGKIIKIDANAPIEAVSNQIIEKLKICSKQN